MQYNYLFTFQHDLFISFLYFESHFIHNHILMAAKEISKKEDGFCLFEKLDFSELGFAITFKSWPKDCLGVKRKKKILWSEIDSKFPLALQFSLESSLDRTWT